MAQPAECSLLDFLDGPEVEPSAEWVAAAIDREAGRRDRTTSDRGRTCTVPGRGQPFGRSLPTSAIGPADQNRLVSLMAYSHADHPIDIDHEALVGSLRRSAEEITAQRGLRDWDQTLARLLAAAVEAVPGVDGGGISQTFQGVVSSSHGTTPDIAALDALQSSLGHGPCIEAAVDPPVTGIVLAHDLADEAVAARWPDFAPAAVDAGYRSLMSIGLSTTGTRRSALNLYAHAPHVFDPPAQVTAGIFGLQAAALLHGADNAAQLGIALESRDLIGQAKGILMERFAVGTDRSFEMLVSSSQDTNMKLVEVARWLVREGNARSGLTDGGGL